MFTRTSSIQFSHRYRFKGVLQKFFNLSLVYWLLLMLIRTIEVIYGGHLNGYPAQLGSVVWASVYRDFIFFLSSSLFLFIIYWFIYYFSPRVANTVYITLTTILLVIQLSLVFYFLTALVPLGADVYGYSMAEMKANGRCRRKSEYFFYSWLFVFYRADNSRV